MRLSAICFAEQTIQLGPLTVLPLHKYVTNGTESKMVLSQKKKMTWDLGCQTWVRRKWLHCCKQVWTQQETLQMLRLNKFLMNTLCLVFIYFFLNLFNHPLGNITDHLLYIFVTIVGFWHVFCPIFISHLLFSSSHHVPVRKSRILSFLRGLPMAIKPQKEVNIKECSVVAIARIMLPFNNWKYSSTVTWY